MTKLAGSLPKGSSNGLESISAQLVEEPDRVQVVVALVDCSRITVNTDEDTSEPTARITAIEPLTGAAVDTARRLLNEAYSQRTGRRTLPAFDEVTGEVKDDVDVDGDDQGDKPASGVHELRPRRRGGDK